MHICCGALLGGRTELIRIAIPVILALCLARPVLTSMRTYGENAKTSTVFLLDGDARVFVSAINFEAGTARVAVNGQDMQTVGAWHKPTFELGEKVCAVSVDGISAKSVQLSAACEE